MTETLEHIQKIIAGRANLIAVSKTYGQEAIVTLLNAGQKQFGENRVQEAGDKWPALREQYPDIELHLIGPLQSNKAAQAVKLFDVIQSVDRLKIAQSLTTEMNLQQRKLPCYIQVNIGREPQKSGIAIEEVSHFLKQCQTLGLNVIGLMCIPPADQDARPYFRNLRELAHGLKLSEISMGMSSDYEIAIEEGATCVRIGSALFGARPQIIT